MMRLITKENSILEVNEEAIKQKSKVIYSMLSNNEEDSDEDTELTVNVDEKTLRKIIEYVEHNHNKVRTIIEKPIKSVHMKDLTDEWNANFIDSFEDNEHIFNLINAADYLDINCLLDLSCAKVASIIKNKTPTEIRKTFNITNDFTPEQEEHIEKETNRLDD